VELDVPAHITYERICRTDEYPLFRRGVRAVVPLSATRYRWELAGASFTATIDECRPDELLRWRSVEGPACGETVTIEPLSPRRSRLTVDVTAPRALLAGLVADLAEFKRRVEHDHPPVGHHVNERPAAACRHQSNWREDLIRRPDDHRDGPF
jgi:uncharacterized membrane protein